MIDENIIRQEIKGVRREHALARRKVIVEAIGLVSKNGGDRKSEKAKEDQMAESAICSFADATAQATGMAARTIREHVA